MFYNLELRWDGVPTLSQAMDQLKAQDPVPGGVEILEVPEVNKLPGKQEQY